MYILVYDFITKYKLLIDNQYGFQKQKSTEHAILRLHTLINGAFERKETACSIFLHFAKAFDTVNHKILITKLDYYGIRGPVLNWLQSYLTNRKQCVQLGYHQTVIELVKHSVPQGSILGPLLFLIYINDIIISTPRLEFLLFADDTSIFISHKDPKVLEENINSELSNILNWLNANKSKCFQGKCLSL